MFGKSLVRKDTNDSDRALSRFQRDLNRLFGDFFGDLDLPFGDWGLRERSLTPRVNVSELEGEVRVTAELPGVEEKDLDVSVTRNTLTIRGEKREEKETKEQDFYRAERSFGSFERSLTLPADVQTDRVTATFANGILTVTLPKTEEAKAQATRVKVKNG